MLDNDLDEAEATAKTLFPTFDGLSEARKAVLLNMASTWACLACRAS
jgi:hypothetical protein